MWLFLHRVYFSISKGIRDLKGPFLMLGTDIIFFMSQRRPQKLGEADPTRGPADSQRLGALLWGKRNHTHQVLLTEAPELLEFLGH